MLVTKYRRKVFNEGVFGYMVERMKELRDHYPEIDVLEIAHDVDHVHMLVSIPPKMSVGKVIGIIKANTSRRMKEKFSFLKKVYWGSDGIWSEGYFVSTVGIDEKIIQEYIKYQGQEDSGQAQLELDL